MGTKILIAAMLLLLAGAVYVGYAGWRSHGPVDIPTSAYVAMGLGVFFTVAVGTGLMALIFYSSRKGYDQPAEREIRRDPVL
jgi:hypothetical protein